MAQTAKTLKLIKILEKDISDYFYDLGWGHSSEKYMKPKNLKGGSSLSKN